MSGAAHLTRLEERFGEAPAIEVARSGLRDVADRAWLVGGAVRDAVLGGDVVDVDIAFDGDVEQAARQIAADAGGHPFELSDDFRTWRVVAHDGDWKIDLAALRAGSIELDLRLRDFTVNAIAVPLAGGTPIDPTGGLHDLEAGTLRACSDRSFADDPLRVLRAARFASSVGFEPEAETVELARRAAPRAAEPAGERQFAELAGLLSGPEPLAGLGILDRLGATAVVLPEIAGLRGVGQSANHHLDAHDHTIEVLRRMLEVERDLPAYCGDASDAVSELLAEPLADDLTRKDALRWAALLHDIGKPGTRTERDGWISFLGHDSLGAGMVTELCGRLRTSRRFASHLAAMTRDHLVLGFMVRERPLAPRRVWEYLSRTAPQSVDTTLLTVADRLSAQGGGVPEEAITGHLELAEEMLAAAVAWEREGPPEPLLRGDEIAAEADIEPGPALGEAVSELEAAQYTGEVTDRAGAVAHLRGWAEAR
jgi:putative nucleotidyltransferase with HDIG domain